MIFTKDDFGPDFHWGVSTAAYQIEGAHDADGSGQSIWDAFVAKKGKIQDGSDGNHACKHYNHYREDIQLINTLNIPNYRFSISWSRIFPNGTGYINQAGVDFYNRLIDTCLKNDVTPWITLYHWDLPQELQKKGGWVNREILNWFEEFATTCVKLFGDRVTNWMVLNEPMVFTGAGYFLGYHAPGKKGINNFLPAMHHATLCQSLGGRIIRDLLPHANIGTTFSCSHIDPASQETKDVKAAKRFDALLNRLFIEPAMGLGYPIEDLPVAKRVEDFIQADDEMNMPFDFDFVGLQNYTREVVKYNWYMPYLQGQIVKAEERGVETTAMGWEVYPPGIHKMLKKFNAYENVKSIIVTENGVAFPDHCEEGKVKDVQRVKFLQAYISEVLKAKRSGIKVDGYFVWSLMDNFEWAEGYLPRFGLVYNDFETQKRIVKDSGYWYSRFLKSSKVMLSDEVQNADRF
ncbi:GH1 family beta-glucosidase [Reichenbachiella agarivorans]|uniref:Beta-glucosidase n=1 Tax=Reichenbachiella agarivorans TaxID=2979464 RepID=A0ABY6CS38_9BACT|nr:GH1 family beta-glucosidase [Reichenbachiella agarivorans]UXP32669.1 GH1 family beta-glucosidase [Reichenbachiella agarivorans]